MIGKGAQYLTAAGFGRYRITAASLGSLDLFRWGWLKYAAWQAIMDAFGEDGPAVIAATNEYLNGIAASDRTKAQQIADWLNVYALEDAKIVMSLVPGIGWRALFSNGAYIVLNMIPTSSMKYKVIGKRKGGSFAGVRNQTYGGIVLGTRSMDFFPSSPSANTRWTFGDLPTTAVVEFDVVDKHCKLYVDGQLYAEKTFTNANGTTTYQMQVFEVCDGGNRYAPASGTDIEISLADIGDVSLIPFKLGEARTAAQCYPNKACAVGTCGMIDLLTGIFYPNANSSGSFTISETPTP